VLVLLLVPFGSGDGGRLIRRFSAKSKSAQGSAYELRKLRSFLAEVKGYLSEGEARLYVIK
jgi:hypothetical protein